MVKVPDEHFEILDQDGRPAGLAPRREVHRKGLWHRSANVFLFHPDGRLFLQRRVENKDVWPGAWDLSVAEHLTPGETFAQAARRGLREELAIDGVDVEPWGPALRFKTIDEEKGIHDYEVQQCFRAIYDGGPRPDPEEVAEVRLMEVEKLKKRVREKPERFTPWLRHSIEALF